MIQDEMAVKKFFGSSIVPASYLYNYGQMTGKLFTVDYYLPIFRFVNKIFCQNFWIYSIQPVLAIAATWGAVWIAVLFPGMRSSCIEYHTERTGTKF